MPLDTTEPLGNIGMFSGITCRLVESNAFQLVAQPFSIAEMFPGFAGPFGIAGRLKPLLLPRERLWPWTGRGGRSPERVPARVGSSRSPAADPHRRFGRGELRRAWPCRPRGAHGGGNIFTRQWGFNARAFQWPAEGMPRSLKVKGYPLTESRGEASGARRVQRGRRTAVSLAPGGGALTGRHNPSPNDGCRPPALTTPNGENSSLNVSCPYLDATPNQVRVTSRYRRPRRARRFPLRPVCFGGIFRPVPTLKIQDHFQSPR